MAIKFTVNGTDRSTEAEASTPLLYVLRDDLELRGPKFGCGLSQCGACSVLVDGKETRSCVTPVAAVVSRKVTAYRPCRAAGRNSLNSSAVASGVGELPPSQREPIAGHKAVYGRPASGNGHLCADRIGLTGDAHHWDEEGYHPKSSLHWDFVGHRFARDRTGSTPGVSAATCEIDAGREFAVTSRNEMEASKS